MRSATLQVELVSQLGSLTALDLREAQMSKREAALSLNASLERRGIGLSFEIADDPERMREAEREGFAPQGIRLQADRERWREKRRVIEKNDRLER